MTLTAHLAASIALCALWTQTGPVAQHTQGRQPIPDPQSPDPTPMPERQWVSLFDGRSLDGWTATGDPDAWSVRDGEIVTVKPGAGGWLRTRRTFRDFELTIDFWLPEGGNSGLGLRGSTSGDPAFTGFEIQILDSSGKKPGLRNCGAVYEAIAPDSMAVHEPGAWNTYRVRLVGDRLDVWLNGTPIHNDQRLDDRGFFRTPDQSLPLNSRATTGHIAIQDHGHRFRYRDIHIRDLSPRPEPAGMIPLIRDDDRDGSPDQWFAEDDANWTVEDGVLIGRSGPGHLFSRRTVEDFELRALVRTNTRGNSGIYFRARPNPDSPWPVGYEAQIDHHDPKNFTGCVYNLAWPERDTPITRDGAWFDYIIRVRGDRIRTWINGRAMVDTSLDRFDTGHIALQGHHPGNVIEFKDLRLLTLPGSETDPAPNSGTSSVR